jgi:hypothetical protein
LADRHHIVVVVGSARAGRNDVIDSRSAISGEHRADPPPARNTFRESIIAEFMTEFFQSRISALPFQVIERFLEWHIIAVLTESE